MTIRGNGHEGSCGARHVYTTLFRRSVLPV
jgi:hypothetical protein